MEGRLQAIKEVVTRWSICDECIGRVFPDVEGKNNRERGKKVRELLKIPPKKGECFFCRDVFERLENIAKRLDVYSYLFNTFILGTKLDEELQKREEMLWNEVGVVEGVESIKKNINRELGKTIEKIYGKRYDPKEPEMEILFLTQNETFLYNPRPLYIYGRYRKYHPMPQSKWPCRYCRGKGCEKCDFTGRQWKETVEYYMSDVLLALTFGTETLLHAAGREDIDARMLGNGRPFVIEIRNPRKRDLDLEEVKNQINMHSKGKIEVLCLKWGNKELVREIKESRYTKVYRVKIRCKSLEKIDQLSSLKNSVITQKTPQRILHRRSDKERKRKVYNISWNVLDKNTAELYIEAEEGLYIKELVTGDDGRTKPSVSQVLNSSCIVEELDIMEVRGGPPCG